MKLSDVLTEEEEEQQLLFAHFTVPQKQKLTPRSKKKKIIIIRGTERIKFNYQDILKGKSLEQNIFLENGDTIVVP